MVNQPTPLAQPSRLQPVADAIAPGAVVQDEEQFAQFLVARSQRISQQTGEPPDRVLNNLLSAAGRVTGAVGRGALGAGRAVREGAEAGFAPLAQNLSQNVAPAIDTNSREAQIVDQVSAASAGVATETIVAPTLSGERLGFGHNQFDQYLDDVARRRQQNTVLEHLTLQAQRDAFRQDQNINPAIKTGIELVSDPTNVIPGGAVVRALRFGARAADAAQGARAAGRLADVAQTGAREIPTAATRGAAQAERSAARQAANAREVIPFGPNRTTEGVPGGVPSGGPDPVERIVDEPVQPGRKRTIDELIKAGGGERTEEFTIDIYGNGQNVLPATKERLDYLDAVGSNAVGRDSQSYTRWANRIMNDDGEPVTRFGDLHWSSQEEVEALLNRAIGDDESTSVIASELRQRGEEVAREGAGILRRIEDVRLQAREAALQRGIDSAGLTERPAPSGAGNNISPDDALEQEILAARPQARANRLAERANPHVEAAAPDGGSVPPPPGKPAEVPSIEGDDLLTRALNSRRAGTGFRSSSQERTDQALLRLHEATINIEERRAKDVVDQGNKRLKDLNIGIDFRGTRVPAKGPKGELDRTVLDEVYRALHGEAEAPARYKGMVEDLRKNMDFESAQRLDFDPEMARVEDYFYRGWKPPENARVNSQGRLVYTPSFKKPRAEATYSEMRAAGFEPLHWNPYEQWRVARMQGVRYRQQMELVDALKQMGDEFILPHSGGPPPEGWRVPQIGPAFEGKNILIKDASGEVVPGAVRQYVVPNRTANSLENMYGKKPNLGTIAVGKWDAPVQKLVDWAVFIPKRSKLFGSFFQQVDFARRAGVGTTTNFIDLVSRGRPDLALQAGLKYPPAVVDMVRANFSPNRRAQLRRVLDSTDTLIEGRDVSMRKVMQQGLSVKDATLIPDDIDTIAREAADGAGVLGLRYVKNTLQALERASRTGLFEGVYPAAIEYDVKNNIAPMMARMYPKLSDDQLAARIASVANTKYSTLPETASVIQNRFMRESARRLFFSVNENEGLLRQATKTFTGADKRYWATHWAGAYLFLIGTANAIHFASTGKPLPLERYTPLTSRGYNTKFAAPDLPFNVGRNSLPVTLDLVGQLDTAFRVLDPKGFVESRLSVPVSAGANQWAGDDFYGNRIDDVGPGGVVSRTYALANDLFGPIGAAPVANRVIRDNVPGASRVVPAGETTLGMGGLAYQGLGENLRAYRYTELQDLKSQQPELTDQINRELTQRKIDYAINDIRNTTSIYTTTNSLKARLREAKQIGYDTAIQVIESELRRRGEDVQVGASSSGGSGQRGRLVPGR